MVALEFDAVVVGGGVAGLWAMNRLRNLGYQCCLVEAAACGAGQSVASQGILHSGIKYNLGSKQKEIAARLKSLPPRWLQCLKGEGELDLRPVKVLSDKQILWAAGGLFGSAVSWAASKALEGEIGRLPREQWPQVFSDCGFNGTIYELHETVLDAQTILAALTAPCRGFAVGAQVLDFVFEGERLAALTLSNGGAEPYQLRARSFLFTAGTGNEMAAERLQWGKAITQRRPLKMILLRGAPEPVYGHCITAKERPRVTITSHFHENQWVWYMGGEVAEKGATLTDEAAIANTREELESIFPGINWRGREWACHSVDRAEPCDPTGHLPPGPGLRERANTVIAWPTKLVYAPELADALVAFVERTVGRPGSSSVAPPPLPEATVGKLPWQLPKTWVRS